MGTQTSETQSVARADAACEAVGVPRRKQWYVAIVNNNTERLCGARIESLGFATYVPLSIDERRTPDGRVKTVARVVIPSVVFVRCTELQRRREVVTLPFVKRFMTDRARLTPTGSHPVAVVTDREIRTLRFLLYNSDVPVTVEQRPVRVGDRVRVVRGKLIGIEGNIVRSGGSAYLVVQLDVLGCAKIQIHPDDVEIVRG